MMIPNQYRHGKDPFRAIFVIEGPRIAVRLRFGYDADDLKYGVTLNFDPNLLDPKIALSFVKKLVWPRGGIVVTYSTEKPHLYRIREIKPCLN